MRKPLTLSLLAVMAVGGLAGCTPGRGTAEPPTGASAASTSAGSSGSSSVTSPAGTSPASAADSTVPAPSPAPPPDSGSASGSVANGAGNADLAIMIKLPGLYQRSATRWSAGTASLQPKLGIPTPRRPVQPLSTTPRCFARTPAARIRPAPSSTADRSRPRSPELWTIIL